MDNVKGKKNKLKLNTKVELSDKVVKWYVEHLASNYSSMHGEIGSKYFPEVYGWLDAFLKKKKVLGKVVGWGSYEVDEKTQKQLDKNFVKVEYVMPNKYKTYSFFSETDLKRVK